MNTELIAHLSLPAQAGASTLKSVKSCANTAGSPFMQKVILEQLEGVDEGESGYKLYFN